VKVKVVCGALVCPGSRGLAGSRVARAVCAVRAGSVGSPVVEWSGG